MRKYEILTGLLICALFAPAALAEGALTIRGEGAASRTPDLVTVSIGVETMGDTAADALAKNSARAQEIVTAAKARGVAPTDIQTAGLALSPVYSNKAYGSSRSGGGEGADFKEFMASNELTIRLRDAGEAGAAIDALVSAGANRLNGVVFGVADIREQLDEARRAAIADAKRKAELFAREADVTLGPIISIDEEGGGGVPQQMMARAMSESSDAPIELGETTVFAAVRVVWRIDGGGT